MRGFDSLINETYSEMRKSARIDGGLRYLSESIPTAMGSSWPILKNSFFSRGSVPDNFVDLMQTAMREAIITNGDGVVTYVFDDSPAGSFNNVAQTLKAILDKNGVDAARNVVLQKYDYMDKTTKRRVTDYVLNDSKIKELQVLVSTAPILDDKKIQAFIKSGGDLGVWKTDVRAPDSLDEQIRQCSESYSNGGPELYLRYTKGLLTTTSVLQAMASVGTSYSMFKGIYPKTADDIVSLFECHLNKSPYRMRSDVELRVDGSKAGRSVLARIVDPSWKPQMDSGTLKYVLTNPKMIDVSNQQSAASFRWIAECAKLAEGEAYLGNESCYDKLILDDKKAFSKYFKTLDSNEELMNAVLDACGESDDVEAWHNMCNNSNAIYDSLTDNSLKTFLKQEAFSFRDTLTYRTVDGPLQGFAGANTFNYYVFSYNGQNGSGDTGYLLNHYPPSQTNWKNTPFANMLRVTDRTRTLGDRVRNIIGSQQGTSIAGGKAMRF